MTDTPLDDDFSELLEAYDDALAAGRTPLPAAVEADPEQLQGRLRQAQQCLELLEQDRLANASDDA